jgi:hypothetical protein
MSYRAYKLQDNFPGISSPEWSIWTFV